MREKHHSIRIQHEAVPALSRHVRLCCFALILNSADGLRYITPRRCRLTATTPFHTRTHIFFTSHPANRNTFLASHNTNRHNSESTMMTGTRYIISNSSNIYSNLSKAISQTRPFFHFKYTKNQRDMEILQQLFPGKITNCQMNIHYACISRKHHIHSLEATGDKCLYFQNPMLSGIYTPQFLRSDEWM